MFTRLNGEGCFGASGRGIEGTGAGMTLPLRVPGNIFGMGRENGPLEPDAVAADVAALTGDTDGKGTEEVDADS